MISRDNILQYIPHRPPFVMVDVLKSVTGERFESEFLILPDNCLVENGVFTEAGLIENIAQTCAASFGFLEMAEGGRPRIGFIGAVSNLRLFERPVISCKINTIVTPTHQLGNIHLVAAQNYLDDRILLSCEMKIVVN